MTLKTRILLLSLATILLVVVTQITASWMTKNELEERLEETTLSGEGLLWRLILTNQMDQMQANTTALARDRDTRNALKDEDTKALAENASTTFNLLSASEIITGLIITDLNAKPLVTFPQELKLGEIALVKKTLSSGKVQRGSIFSANGTPFIAVTFPLLIRGKPIGGAVYIRSLDAAVQTMKNSNESDIVLLHKDGTPLLATNEELFTAIEYEAPSLGSNSTGVKKVAEQTMEVVTHPLNNFEGTARGYLVTIKDHTKSFAKQEKITWLSYLLTISIITVMTLGLSWYISRSFMKLHAVISIVKDVAMGDLTPSIDKSKSIAKDETGQLTKAMSSMLDNLGTMVVEINKTTGMLATASEELTAISAETNKSLEKQLGETAQVATAITELASTAQEVARNAADAASAADAANHEAQEGAQASGELASAISKQINETNLVAESLKGLQEQANKITDIMGVINDIAEQTNLLALNAAIEAARAGEQGRGFAVVADEVRTLASRTQQSTKEIEETVSRLHEETDKTVATMNNTLEGSSKTQEFVGQATERLNNIATSVANISQMITQIATATEEQTAVTAELDKNVVNISQLAQKVSEDSTHTTSATTELSQLAHQLELLVNQFKTSA